MSRPRALWVRLRNVSPLEMLRVEEALFRADKRTWFVTNSWDHGAASKPEGERERGAAGTSGAATSGAASRRTSRCCVRDCFTIEQSLTQCSR